MTKVQPKSGGNVIGIITMIFLFGMIGFVTNLAAPIGTIWNEQFTSLGMLGNAMNFLAYLFMGIPAGKLLTKIGYKKTALTAIAVGLVGIFVQFLSGKMGTPVAGFVVYLTGALIAGFCVCLLNTVVNPMLNLLAGAGNKGNQMIQIGGSFNSLLGTLAPMVVMAMVGEVAGSSISQVDPVLYLAMGVFALTFIALLFIPLKEIHKGVEGKKFEKSPWAFRHFVLGAVAIFVYVGVEVGIPGTILYWFSDVSEAGAGLPVETAAGTAGVVAAMYWLLMLVGRFVGGAIGGKVSSRAMMICATGIAALLVFAAIIIPSSVKMTMPAFSFADGFSMVPNVPLSALLFVLCGLFTSVMWGAIFNLATEGLGKYIPLASGIFMMMVVGGGIIPLAQQFLGSGVGYLNSYWLPLAGILYMFFYALVGCKNVNKNIKVD
jgi:FHS family L-fucose permease-like MFS transporter